jgi:uncharacterized protein YkuJ
MGEVSFMVDFPEALAMDFKNIDLASMEIF